MKAIAAAAVFVAASVLATLALEREPTPLAANADPGVFSGERAQALREELLGGSAPHPVGSTANDLVRERVVTAFEREGYAPWVEDGWACSGYGTCARARNVIAATSGDAAGPPLILAAHYDSVGA